MADRRFVTVDDGYLFPTPLEARLGAKITTAKTDAIADATTKYGGLPARVTAAESKNTQQDLDIVAAKWDKGVLTADLNEAQSSGRWTVNATNLPNRPADVAGELIAAWGNTTGVQTFTTRETPVVTYYRRYAAPNWGPWHQGSLSARIDAIENPRSLNAGESLDTLLTQGRYMQVFTDRPLLSLGYPVKKTGYLRVSRWNSAGTHVVQEYFPLDDPATYTRIIYSSSPRPWIKHEDAAAAHAYADAAVETLRSDLPSDAAPPTVPRKVITHTEIGHPFYVAAGVLGDWDLNDTTDKAVGFQSMRFTTDGNGAKGAIKADIATPIDLTKADLQLWIKVDDWATNGGISIFVGDSGLRNYYQWSLDSPNERLYLQAGSWHLLTIPFVGHNKIGGSPDRANLTHIQLSVIDKKAGALTVHFGPIYAIPKSPKFPNGVVSFSFDDTLESLYTQAKPVLDKYGFSGTAYVNTESVGQSGRASMSQLRQMQDWSGWEIAGHSFTSAGHNDRFTSLTEAELEMELGGLAQWLKDSNFNGTSVAYPGGSYNDLVSEVALRHFKAGRTIAPFFETLPPGNLGTINTAIYVLSGTTTVAHMKAMVDQAWDEGYWLHMCFHDILPVVIQTTDYPTSEFDEISAYIAGKGIPMRTVGQVLDEVL